MFQLPSVAVLTDCQDGKQVDAKFIELTRDLAQQRIDKTWWTGLEISRKKRRAEEDHHWRWWKKVGGYRNDPFIECVAVQTPDQEIQGAMVYRIDGTSVLELDQGTVYVEYLATAPRNRPLLVPHPNFRGVGSALLTLAMARSYLLGFRGRLNLVSLPSAVTEQWYNDRGFVPTHIEESGMRLFELPASTAADWLHRIGLL